MIYPDAWEPSIYEYVGRTLQAVVRGRYNLATHAGRREYLKRYASPLVASIQKRVPDKTAERLSSMLGDMIDDQTQWDFPHVGGLGYLHLVWGVEYALGRVVYDKALDTVRGKLAKGQEIPAITKTKLDQLYATAAFYHACQVEAGRRLKVLTGYNWPDAETWAEAITNERLTQSSQF